MPLVGFEPTISVGERPQTYALDRAATGTGLMPLAPTLMLLAQSEIHVGLDWVRIAACKLT